MRPIDPNDWSDEDRQQARWEFQYEAHKSAQMLIALEVYWRATDPEFEAKVPRLREYQNELTKQLMAGSLHPSRVAGLVQDCYLSVTRAMQAEAGETRSIH